MKQKTCITYLLGDGFIMKKRLLSLTTAVATLSFLVGAPLQTAVLAQDTEVIATIGEKELTKEDLYEEMKALYGNITLRTLILETVLEQNVADPEVSRKAAAEEVQTQVDQAGGEEIFAQLLAYQQLGTIEEFTHQIEVRNMLQEVVEKNVDMSDEAIQAFYDNEYMPAMEAQHILVETEEEALAAIERINAGEEFDAVAQEISLDSSAANGGLLSPFTTGQMVPEFEEAVKGLENGAITEMPVQSQYGFHVIKTLNNGEKAPLADVKEEVTAQYLENHFNDSQFSFGIVGKLIESSGVEILDADLEGAVQDLIDLANQPVEAPAEEVTEESTEESTEEASEETEAESEDAE